MQQSARVEKYESAFARWFGSEHAMLFWKGRVALYAILRAMGIASGDEVILPGYTCVMNVNPVMYVGARPVYVDIEPETFNMDPALLEEKITDKTKLIIAQHTYGYPCDMDRILAAAQKRGIPVVEDCCLALGSQYRGRRVGTFGSAAYFSFQWNKPYTTGLGGMAVTNDAGLAGRIHSLRSEEAILPASCEEFMLRAQLLTYRLFIYPRTTALAQQLFRHLTKKGAVVGSSHTSEFSPVMPEGFFKAATSVQAASGMRQLVRVEANISHRRRMAEIYDRLFQEKGWSARKYNRDTMNPVMVRYPVRIAEKQKALEEAASAGIELGSWFECTLHPIETPLSAYGYEAGMCPEAERASAQVVNLPLHPRAGEKTARRTVEFITRFTQI